MKNFLSLILVVLCLSANAQDKQTAGYPISPVPFTAVKVTDSFWGQRLKASRETTIPLAFSKCEETGRYENFVHAAHPSDTIKVTGFSFDDTDVYKTIEGASYSMQTYPDPKLDKYIDSVLTIVAAAQEPDGYLYTSRTMNPAHPHEWAGEHRWEKEEDLSHELYDLGHMIEGAIAHYQATGKRNFLDISEKFADCAVREVGPNPGQATVVPGHQIAEMAMAKLYVLTGKKEYLDFAKYLLDERGHTTIKSEYSQSHRPVLEQDEAVGHAVRAAYMYTGMADVAALTGDTAYIHAIDRIWDNIVGKKLYITGGIGATGHGEAFGENYELPNMSAYCETCAAIGNVYMNYRLFLLHGESKYFDVLERTLYNGLISGISLDGDGFFYPNPLESIGQHQRQAWFGCACCPSNVCRFIPSLPGYIYAVHDNDLYVNLFMSNTSEIEVDKKLVSLTQSTKYPWNGDIELEVAPKKKQNFNLKIRIPGWVLGEVVPSDLYAFTDKKKLSYSVKVNDETVESELKDGYFTIGRSWKKGDKVSIHFDMEPRTVKAHPLVEADQGKISIERGPVVYCAEWPDNDFSVLNAIVPQKPKFKVESKPDLLYGLNMISTDVQLLSYNEAGKIEVKDAELHMIPYYAWAHRGSGEMAVWLANEISASRPVQQPTIASESKIDASHLVKAISSINDGLVPKDENDRTVPYYHWWPKEGTTEWISYEFEEEKTVSSSTVYWYDDAPWGGCRIPEWYKVYYKDTTGEWVAVENTSDYIVKKGIANELSFKPVKTTAIKLEIKLPEKYATGIFEWSLD
ncbi:glycoside hydrolase family 127 protein [Mangrovibacterium lignilyticum]|uniref:glycoside hydrolase family 127 protein n=1 Tax=Mangrovibacterium lignilyticum TaxID=2668052 RepID=UPI0013D70D52|nr:glycoside hydrolase family 127 protein [Mangrovibacterium lignilyticum]